MNDDLPDFIEARITTPVKDHQESVGIVWGIVFTIVTIFLIAIICSIK